MRDAANVRNVWLTDKLGHAHRSRVNNYFLGIREPDRESLVEMVNAMLAEITDDALRGLTDADAGESRESMKGRVRLWFMGEVGS